MSLTRAWASHFSRTIRERGRQYFEKDNVSQLLPDEGVTAKASVSGGEFDYEVAVYEREEKQVVNCTCPHFERGYYCKHIWAVLLDIDRNGIKGQEADASAAADSATSAIPRAAKARKRDASQPAKRQQEPEWSTRLMMLASGRSQIDNLYMGDGKRLAYVVIPQLSNSQNALVIDVRFTQPTQTGWSKLKPYKFNDDALVELVDPIDRDLCSTLLGATWVDEFETGDWSRDRRRRSTYRLPASASYSLIKRMLSTNRCHIERKGGTTAALRWDDQGQWKLWTVGRQSDEGLEIEVELRRGETVRSVDDPHLMLGGPQGLVFMGQQVAEFDDGGAFRWVTYFREAASESEPSFGFNQNQDQHQSATRALTIPPADVETFVQRLYMLPELPNLDLPTDIAVTPKEIAPTPQIDLHTPPGGGKGKAKNQLVADVWFNYGERQVKPDEPGRFVTVWETVDAAKGDDDVADVTAASNSDISENANEDKTDSAAAALSADSDEGYVLLDGSQGGVAIQTVDSTETAEGAKDEVASESDELVALEGKHRPIARDIALERSAVQLLPALGFKTSKDDEAFALTIPSKRVPKAVAALLARGWRVQADKQVVRTSSPPKLSIKSGVDWFELHGDVKFETTEGEQSIPLPQILAAARSGRTMITLDDGSQGMLPQQWLSQNGLLSAIGQVEEDHLRFDPTQAAMIDVLVGDSDEIDVDEKFAESRQRLKQFESIKEQTPTKEFQGKLRTYQREGLGWLEFLKWFGMGGILADDMGLGKTVQVLALIDKVRQDKDTKNPTLVVVPRSVVFNWMDEARKFTPDLKVLGYSGPDRKELFKKLGDYDIVVTSYGLLRRDIEELKHYEFEYAILDEAQAIKNPGSQVAKAARLINAKHRLALTGTPVENHLGDLWSIFEFLNPRMLGSATRFAEMMRGAREPADSFEDMTGPSANGFADVGGDPTLANGQDGEAAGAAADAAAKQAESSSDNEADATEKLNTLAPVSNDATMTAAETRQFDAANIASKAIRPFILRRTKQQVLTELPAKTEQTIVCEMGDAQRKIYDDLLKYYRGSLLNRVGSSAGGSAFTGAKSGTPMMVLEALLRLRQAACHPGLINDNQLDHPSAKLETLLEQLAELIDEGHKTLVFSQFTSMLSIVRKKLDQLGVPYEYLDGKTRDREQCVKRFQSDEDCPIFLISLKAGGLGLNLTAADYVFILDPWWNPAVEQQAIDRAHRIGQTRHVTAYRLICKDTVEQRIADLQDKKKKLADAIVGGQQNLLKSLTREDLELLLS